MEQDYSQQDVLFNDDARKNIFKGLATVYKAVSSTMGPKGKNVIIEKRGTLPLVTKDGVTVARSVKLKNRVNALGAELIKEAASQTNEEAGDGTTTATVLTYELCFQALKLLSAGYSQAELREGIEESVNSVINNLKDTSVAVRNNDDIMHIATISANGDKTIGSLISSAVKSVGKDGVITIESAKGTSTSLEVIDGMKLDNRGYLSSYFITNEKRMSCELNDVYVLLTDRTIDNINDILPVLEQVRSENRSLLIVADDVTNDALQALVLNKLKGTLKICAIKAPGYGESRINMLHDIAALTNGNAVLRDTGIDLKNVTVNDLGTCKKIVVDRSSTVLVCDNDTKKIKERIEQIKQTLTDPTLISEEKNLIKKRLANLSNGAAVIRVGGSTEVEMLERKDRVEDALNATRAAVEEGIVAGGGIALLRASDSLTDNKPGDIITKAACVKPFSMIMENAGCSKDVVLEKILNSDQLGFDARTEKYCDPLESGIIDPVKVTRCALKNALSVALMFISLECAIFDYSDAEL
jgi:chaperonin GroEL